MKTVKFVDGKQVTVKSKGVDFYPENKKFNNLPEIKGTLVGNERGYAFLVPENGGEDFFISHTDLGGAMHGDTVVAVIKEKTDRRTTAKVVKVLDRGIKELVGTFSKVKSGGFVIPDDKKYFNDVYVPYHLSKKAKTGDKVVCEVQFYPRGSNPEGEIIDVLGRQFDCLTEVKSIAIANKIEIPFNKQVVLEAEAVAVPLTRKDLIGRKDLRGELTVTIDGEDAKDFDDAISVKKCDNGDYILSVHIADVSHYVKENSILDASAFSRGTSMYFPELVIPMLPESLCNGMCSLRPNEDRLTLSCVMRINSDGEVIDNEIFPSVINSKARLTYTAVYDFLSAKTDGFTNVAGLNDMLKNASDLADILSKKRDSRGSIDLDVKEAKITVKNNRVEVSHSQRNKAHKLIEEFMIVANETVAEYAYYLDIPFLYRIHEKPTEEKILALLEFLKGLGRPQKWHSDNVYPKDFQALLNKLKTENDPTFTLINRVMLRSMQKAKYNSDNIGHFGLSSKCYCHFTSPIRRYPDLVVHRVLKAFFKGQDVHQIYDDFVNKAAVQSGEKERNAELAERAVDDYYKMLYISDYIGCEFTGIISGVQSFGVFVELPSTVEGIVKIDTIRGKGFEFDDKNYRLFNAKRSFKLGQTVEIVVVGVDLVNRRAEFMLKDDYLNCK